MRAFDAVLFDLDDTLHDDTRAYKAAALEVASEIAVERGADADALTAAYIAQAEGFWTHLTSDDLQRPLGDARVRMWGSALRELGIDDEELAHRCARNYNRYRRERLTLLPGAAQLLRDLRERGCKLALLTNGFAETHREKIAVLEIGELFDAIFIADEVGMVKPDPALFAHACNALQCAPARSAMVGDRYGRDIGGAHEAGLYTVWMNVHGESLPAGAPAADAVVYDIVGIRAALLGQ
jgi:putative hydrolase of the HAD superfamily